MKRRWRPLHVGKAINVELFLKANHIQINNDHTSVLAPDRKEEHESFWIKYSSNPMEGRDIILKSICPEVKNN